MLCYVMLAYLLTCADRNKEQSVNAGEGKNRCEDSKQRI
jgi:hypothetical protein